ncbi:MAG: methyltransferase, partial [Egibacteraceae bacterium]
GDSGDLYREQLASPEGWPLILGRYAAAMAAGVPEEAPSASEERAGAALLDMVFGYMPAQVIRVAAELGIADALRGGPKTNEELAAATGAHPPSLLRLIRALATLGVLAEVEVGRFDLLPLGTMLRSDEPGAIRELARLFCHDTVWQSWGRLGDSVRTGEVAFEQVTGMDSFAYFAQHPALSASFNEAMAQHTRDIAPAVVAGYDFSAFPTVCDVGGGSGALLAAILAASPDARGILFDTAAGLEEAPSSLAAAGVTDRCDIEEGDFFKAVPNGADAYVLKSVIHDWDDERSVAILTNCRRAMREDAKLLLVEYVLPEKADPTELMGIPMSDLNMLVATGGRERTQAEFEGLFKAAGLSLTSVTPALGSTAYRVIEGAA